MASDPLSVENILKHMAEALPTHAKDDPNSDISSSYEAIALFAHACMTAVGFRLLGFGENQKIGELLFTPQSLLWSLTRSQNQSVNVFHLDCRHSGTPLLAHTPFSMLTRSRQCSMSSK
jgi:hypothetical protein